MEEHEIHDEDARTIVRMAARSSGRKLVIAEPTALPSESDGKLEDSLMAIQTVAGALIMPFLVIAGLFGASMTRD